MSSYKSDILKLLIRNTINRDPVKFLGKFEEKHQESVSTGKDFEKVPHGFVLTKEQTPDGTEFLRLRKRNMRNPRKIILYLHGGAYISGLFSTYFDFASKLSKATRSCQVIFLDYHLAPEYKYPVQHNEALDLWKDLTTRQGYLPENIIVGGDSAGGNLTLSLMLKLRDSKMEMPKAGFCISPWADMTGSGESFKRNFSKDVMFGKKGIEYTDEFKEEVLASEIYSFVGDADRTDPYVSPVYGEYHDFPPMFFTAGGEEMLLSDTVTIVDKLKKCKVPVGYDIQPKMFHIYTLLGDKTPESAVSFRKLMAFIKKYIN